MNTRTSKKWTTEEYAELAILWKSGANKHEIEQHFPHRSYQAIRKQATHTLKLGKLTNYCMGGNENWVEEETNKLIESHNENLSWAEIQERIPTKTPTAIRQKAIRLNLPPRQELRKQMLIKRNKAMGRDLSEENLMEIGKKYKTRSQFYREDNQAYTSARNLGLLDKMEHMSTGLNFNYPQTALFEIVKILFPNKTVKYNDRKTLGNRKELDVYVLEDKIAFEYDGVEYHTSEEDKRMDAEKEVMCKEKGISLFRILEVVKDKPIHHILNQLGKHGFDVSYIELQDIQSKITKYYMNLDDIKAKILEYTEAKVFRQENTRMYNFLKRNDMLNLLDHIQPVKVTIHDIVDALNSCHNKSEFREKYYGHFIRIHRFRKCEYSDLWEMYQNLKNRRQK